MKYHYTVYKIEQTGKLSNKEHLNDNELDKWMNKTNFANIRVERNDGNWVEYTTDGKKFVVKKKGKKGLKESRDIVIKLDEFFAFAIAAAAGAPAAAGQGGAFENPHIRAELSMLYGKVMSHPEYAENKKNALADTIKKESLNKNWTKLLTKYVKKYK